MTARLAPWTVRIHELLADGEWHNRDDIITAAMPLVPPGRAIRRAEQERHRKGHTGPRTRGDTDTAHTTGARSVVQRSIQPLIRRGRIQQRTIDGTAQIRRGRPAAPPGRPRD